MNHWFARLLAGLCLSLSLVSAAEPAKEKSPADLAADAYFKLRDNKEAKPTADRLQQVLKAGLDFIGEYPTHARTNGIINSLATFGNTMGEKSQAALREHWLAQVSYEIANRRVGSSDELRAALAALDAAAVGAETKEKLTRENLTRLRDKIDALAGLPGGNRFLVDREREYLDLLRLSSPATAEAFALKLSEHKDKKVAAMARDELNLMELRKQPIDLKFTALDGRVIDLATYRKKSLAIFFWSTANANSAKDLEQLRSTQATYSKVLEVITVSYDAEADRAKLEQFIKDKKVKWPVYFDGKGKEGETWAKLNVRNVPTLVLVYPDGTLANANLRLNRLEPEVKKIAKIK